MKATLDIPDDLYRRVKARSAIEGRPVRSVAVELFQNWLEAPKAVSVPAQKENSQASLSRFDQGAWMAIAAKHVKPGMSHDLDQMREAAGKARGMEIASKLQSRKANG